MVQLEIQFRSHDFLRMEMHVRFGKRNVVEMQGVRSEYGLAES